MLTTHISGTFYDMAGTFEPTEIALTQSGTEMLLVARDPANDKVGIVCPPDLAAILQSFISGSNPSLIRFWKTYAQSKGAGTFFWDIIGIAEGIRDLSHVPRHRRLLHFTSESDLFHNSWQARLMRLCVMRGQHVELIRPGAERREADFLIHPDTAVEVKTVFSVSGIEIDEEEGVRLAPPDGDKVARTVTMKVRTQKDRLGNAELLWSRYGVILPQTQFAGLGTRVHWSRLSCYPGRSCWLSLQVKAMSHIWRSHYRCNMSIDLYPTSLTGSGLT